MPAQRFEPRRLSFLLLGLLLAAVVGGLGVVSFQENLEDFQPLGFHAERAAGGWRVTEVTSEASTLATGDLILLVNGQEASNVRDLGRVLRLNPEAQLTAQRGEELRMVAYARPPLEVDFSYLILAVLSVLYLAVGLYTLLRQPRHPGFLFYLWCLLYAALFLLSPRFTASPLDQAIYGVDTLARVLLPALTVHLFLVFPAFDRDEDRRRAWRILPFAYLPAAVLLTLEANLMFSGGRWLFGELDRKAIAYAITVLERLELYYLVIFAFLAAGVLAYRLRRRREWEGRRQLQWIAFGIAGGYVPFLLLEAIPFFLGWSRSELQQSAAVIFLSVVPVTFAYAILRYKLWDLEVVIRNAVSYGLTLVLGVLGFSVVHQLLMRGLPEELSVARNLLAFMAGLTVAGLVLPARGHLSSALERLQYGHSFGKRQALAHFADELMHERDLERLSHSLLDRLEEALELDAVNLYLVQPQRGGALRPARPGPRLPAEIEAGALGEDLWQREVTSLPGAVIPTLPRTALQQLFVLGYRYAFPLTVQGVPVGALLVGYKSQGRPLNSDDLDLIHNLLRQASLAIENARLLTRLHHQLEEVGRLRHYSEGIIESSPAGIAVLDGEERVVSANLAFAAIAGVERGRTAGRRFEELVPVRPLPAPGGGLLEVSYGTPDGEEHYLQLTRAPFAGGGEEWTILVVHDISSQVALENALKEKDRLASLGVLAAGVAHEVNTPLTGISSYAQFLLADTPEGDPHHEVLKKVERQAFRASRIVNNLLEFARDRRGERREVAVANLVGEATELLRDRFHRRNVRLIWEPPAEEITVLANDGELQQVFTNLILNAIDAMTPQGGGELRVRLTADETACRIRFEDSGPGIPPERREKIFEPFFSTKLGQGGTGLGLAISHDIVARHGGTMEVESEPGEGTSFHIELPRHAVASRSRA